MNALVKERWRLAGDGLRHAAGETPALLDFSDPRQLSCP
jgi:hypothetical protein